MRRRNTRARRSPVGANAGRLVWRQPCL